MSKSFSVSRYSLLGVFLDLVFILSFIPYITKINTVTLLLGPITLIILATFVLPIVFPAKARYAFSALKRPRLLILAFVVPAFPTIVAIGDGKWYAVIYALLMSGVLCAVQVLLFAIPLDRIIHSFVRAGAICIWSFFVVSFTDMIQAALSATRFVPTSAQPNVIGFIFAGFVTAMAWITLEKQHSISTKIFYMSTIAAGVVTIFLISSRASMLALFLAATGAIFLSVVLPLKRGRMSKGQLLVGFSITVVAIGLFLFNSSSHEKLIEYISNFLQLNSNYRGIGSGLSGRITRWAITLSALTKGGTWLFGAGYRTSGTDLGFSIDNGYLTLWYESGLIGLLFVIGQMIWVLRLTINKYLIAYPSDRNLILLILFSIVIVLMVNNFFDRYLFGLGNPFSLLALFILLLNRHDIYKTTVPNGDLVLKGLVWS